MSERTRRRRGTGTIEDAGSGRKRLRLTTAAGRLSLGTVASQEAAEALLEQARAELAQGHAPALSLRVWGARELDRRELAGIAGIATERSRWRTHVEGTKLAALPLPTLRRADLLTWLDALCAKRAQGARGKGQKLGRSTIQNVLNLVRVVLEAAVEREVLPANPALGVKVPRRASRTHEPWTYLRADELARLLACAAIPYRDRLWLGVAIGTGLRLGELTNLRLVDVHPKDPAPHVVVRFGSKSRGPKNTRGKASKIRRVPLFGLGLEAMRAWLAELPAYCPKNPLGLVFPGSTGARKARGKHLHRTVRTLQKDGVRGKPRPLDPLPSYLAAAQIVRGPDEVTITWHSLRHTCAAALISGYWGRRWTLAEIGALLGHASITTTERYAHLAESALARAAAETVVKPAISPRPVRVAPPILLGSPEESSRSHLRDLNSRPTVYEGSSHPSDIAPFDPVQARGRAFEAQEALAALGEGKPGPAAALLAALIAEGDSLAREALAAVASGSWRPTIDRLASLLSVEVEPLEPAARKAGA